MMNAVTRDLSGLVARLHARLLTTGRDRGDMVGWILITVMTAALIAVLWAVLGPQLQDLLEQALNKAKGSVPG